MDKTPGSQHASLKPWFGRTLALLIGVAIGVIISLTRPRETGVFGLRADSRDRRCHLTTSSIVVWWPGHRGSITDAGGATHDCGTTWGGNGVIFDCVCPRD